MNEFNQDQLTELDVQYDSEAKTSLFNMGKWTRFLSWSMFIFSALFLLIIILAATVFNSYLDKVIPGFSEMGTGIYIAIALGVLIAMLIYLAAFYFLFIFSTKIKQGLLTEDTATINTALGSLKTYFIISTVLGALALLINFFTTIFN
jgi:hypothetical protein